MQVWQCGVVNQWMWDSNGNSVGVAVVGCWVQDFVPVVGWEQSCGCHVGGSAALGNSEGVVLGRLEGVGFDEEGRVVVGCQDIGCVVAVFWTVGQRVHWDTLAVDMVLVLARSSEGFQWVGEDRYRPREGKKRKA